MGERASIRVKSGTHETLECIYLHWGGNKVGDILMEAEANATSTDPDDCLNEIFNAAQSAGYSPEREVISEGFGDGSNAGNFVIDVSNPAWKVEIESEYGYGLRGESKYHFGLKEFQVPTDPNGYPKDDGRTDNHRTHHLFNAVNENDERMVRALLDAGANPNIQEKNRSLRTPLNQCVYNENGGNIAQMLLSAGADLTLKDDRGDTPKKNAYGNEEVLAVIEQHEAYLKSKDDRRELSVIAQASRPQDSRPADDLADPEEVMARQSRTFRL